MMPDEVGNCLRYERKELTEREAGKIGRTGRVGIGRAGRHASGIGRKAESKQQVRHIGQKRAAQLSHRENRGICTRAPCKKIFNGTVSQELLLLLLAAFSCGKQNRRRIDCRIETRIAEKRV
jgi:hypothetical protein